jgi:hypothetical protein
MPADNKTARKARAQRLRKQISGLVSPVGTPGPAPSGESPRQFIERRMAELAKKEKLRKR